MNGNKKRARRGPFFFCSAALLAATTLGGCTTVAQVTTLDDPACRQTTAAGFAKILEAQGESTAVAAQLASSTTGGLSSYPFGPRPFVVASPSGVDFGFFVERKGESCLLRVYGRQKGFVSYTNNLTYIDSEPLASCRCAD